MKPISPHFLSENCPLMTIDITFVRDVITCIATGQKPTLEPNTGVSSIKIEPLFLMVSTNLYICSLLPNAVSISALVLDFVRFATALGIIYGNTFL